MSSARDIFISGLKNAHAMENQSHEMLERQAERLTDFPDLQSKVREHLVETREQMQRIEQCLTDLGSSPSLAKDTALAFGANLAAVGQAVADDEVLKYTFADNALEHYEIAAYKSLLTMAEQAGIGAVSPLQQSLREEERMGDWVENHVQPITMEYLRREERAVA
jgi:ferritin-like metal-binding protein YciE